MQIYLTYLTWSWETEWTNTVTEEPTSFFPSSLSSSASQLLPYCHRMTTALPQTGEKPGWVKYMLSRQLCILVCLRKFLFTLIVQAELTVPLILKSVFKWKIIWLRSWISWGKFLRFTEPSFFFINKGVTSWLRYVWKLNGIFYIKCPKPDCS